MSQFNLKSIWDATVELRGPFLILQLLPGSEHLLTLCWLLRGLATQ